MKQKYVRRLLMVLTAVFAVTAAVSGWQLIKIMGEYKKGDKDLEQMYAAMESAGEQAAERLPEIVLEEDPGENAKKAEEEAELREKKEAEAARLLQYQELKKANPDVAGWIRLDGTVIDYPVMYTPDRPDYYLKRGFDGKYSAYGMIYMDEDCDPAGYRPNYVLYGHHMKNGSMFAALEKYVSEEFYREHPAIQFDTLRELGQYEVAAVFKLPAAQITEEFAENLLAATEEDYKELVAYAKEHSLYDTGITPQWPEQLLILGTCEYTYRDGRLFVVARRMD